MRWCVFLKMYKILSRWQKQKTDWFEIDFWVSWASYDDNNTTASWHNAHKHLFWNVQPLLGFWFGVSVCREGAPAVSEGLWDSLSDGDQGSDEEARGVWERPGRSPGPSGADRSHRSRAEVTHNAFNLLFQCKIKIFCIISKISIKSNFHSPQKNSKVKCFIVVTENFTENYTKVVIKIK